MTWRLAGALLALALPIESPGFARSVLPVADDPAAALSRYLRVLSTNPVHLESLIGAGRAALAVGDPSAAIGFFARAEELDPRNGRAKAGLGSAMVQLEQPKPALKLFDDATDLGMPLAEIAADRGLAYDLRGDPRRAQADYALALRGGVDPETVRRLALSLAISGDQAAALAALDAQLRAQDRAGWRTRAFVLALTGDGVRAAAAAEQAMPGGQGAAMGPFLARLGGLRAAQKAMAAHFGRLPSDRRVVPPPTLLADARASASRAELVPVPVLARAGALVPQGRAFGVGGTPTPAVTPVAGAGDGWTVEVAPLAVASIGLKALAPPPPRPLPPATVVPKPSKPATEIAKAELTAKAKIDAKAKPAADAKAKLAADAKAKTAAEEKAKKAALAKAKAAPPKTPERYWVQIASGANKADLGKVWVKQKSAQPKLLGSRQAWTAPWRASNRLLTGPFDSEGAAQSFVNTLGKSGVSAMQFTTRAGIEVEQIAAK